MTDRMIKISAWGWVTMAHKDAMMLEKCRQDALDDLERCGWPDYHEEEKEGHDG